MKKHVFCRHNSEFEVQFFDVDSMTLCGMDITLNTLRWRVANF